MSAADELAAFHERVRADAAKAFLLASDGQKEDALKIATAEIDRIFVFKGHKAKPNQSLAWPRTGVEGVKPDEVPQCVMDASAFLAGAHLAGYRIGPDDLERAKLLLGCLFLMLDPVIDADASVQNTHPIQ